MQRRDNAVSLVCVCMYVCMTGVSAVFIYMVIIILDVTLYDIMHTESSANKLYGNVAAV